MKNASLKYTMCFLLLFLGGGIQLLAQTKTYQLVHQGNRTFRKGDYKAAQSFYFKAQQGKDASARTTFNLGNTYLAQGDPHTADSLFAKAAQSERNPIVRSMAHHNRGYICQRAALENQQQQQQLLRQAIEHYKQALRLNPRDNDTRYNLALCQKQLKDNQDQQKNQQKQQQQQQKQQEQKQQQQQQQQNKDNEQNKQTEQERQQMEQYLNLARQAEQRTLQRLKKQQSRQRALRKNW